MHTKLTLRLDDQLIASAKHYAQARGQSVSALVGDYFAQLAGQTHLSSSPTASKNGPITRSLRGALSAATADELVHKNHLLDKHQ